LEFVPWMLIGGLAAGATLLVGRTLFRRSHQESAARASGLEATSDLSDVPVALQRSALWSLSDGGFEQRVVAGKLTRDRGDVSIWAFDLETLRERRGEWAWLPVEPPFRIAGVVSVVVCAIDRTFPHILLKRAGRGDELHDDSISERLGSISKVVREGLRLARSYAAELPAPLPQKAVDVALPEHWRAYTTAPDLLASLCANGLATALDHASRRDLVVELIEGLVIVYPAGRELAGADAFADLTTTAQVIVDGVLAASQPLTPRGVDVTTT
jgi:hypothetical protein